MNDVFEAIVDGDGRPRARGRTRFGTASAIGFRSTGRRPSRGRQPDGDPTTMRRQLHRRRHREGGGGARGGRGRPAAVGRDGPRPRDRRPPRGPRRPTSAILFRSRDSHREFEAALERRGVSTYVYKGLGFFDADEIQDAVALLRYLADPLSDLRAAALLRSRIVRLSDAARGAPRLDDGRRRSSAPIRCRPSRRSATKIGRVLDRLRACRAAMAVVGGPARRRRSCSTRCCARRPTRTSCAGRAAGRRARTSRSCAAWSGASRTAATRRSPASPTISSGWPSATSRTPRSTRSTPSA